MLVFQPPVFTAFNRLFPGLPQVIDTLNIGSAIVVAKLRMSYGGLDLKDPYTDEDAASGAPIMPCLTREATEVFLRKAVKESRPNVVFKTGTVSGFLAQEKSLTGVTVRENGVERQEQANFVIGKSLKALRIRKYISLLTNKYSRCHRTEPGVLFEVAPQCRVFASVRPSCGIRPNP